MFARFVEIKDVHTHQTIIMNAQIQMKSVKLVVCMVAMTADGDGMTSCGLRVQNYQNTIQNERSK